MPYLKVNNTVYKGKAMESVESEMILRMKKPRKEGKPVTEDDHWGSFLLSLLVYLSLTLRADGSPNSFVAR